jgi:predicted DNA-binding antitoxin AbrB/MazE fold protein
MLPGMPASSSGAAAVTLTVEAVYENGVLKSAQPLPLKEHEKVQITVHPRVSNLADSYGIMGWTGDAETLRRIAEDPEFSILEAYDHEELARCVEGFRQSRCQSPPP